MINQTKFCGSYSDHTDYPTLMMSLHKKGIQLYLTEIERSGKMPLQLYPELRPNQIPKHMPVSGAPVKAGVSVKTDLSGKTGRSIW